MYVSNLSDPWMDGKLLGIVKTSSALLFPSLSILLLRCPTHVDTQFTLEYLIALGRNGRETERDRPPALDGEKEEEEEGDGKPSKWMDSLCGRGGGARGPK